MSYKTQDGKTHQTQVIIGQNGLPVDSIATLAGSYVFLSSDVDSLLYGGSIVTLSIGNDLTELSLARARYTGRYVLITKDGQIYYINRSSIDVPARTFAISKSDSSQVVPVSIDLSPGWVIAEADIVNRLATTSAAKIDSIEFRDMHFQMQLDGDPVSVRGENGSTLEPNPDGSLNVVDNPIRLPTVVNTPLPTVGTEYTINLPVTARRFLLKSRDPATLYLTYVSNGSQYITIKSGNFYSEDNLKLDSPLSIYIKSNKTDTVIETVYWE